MTDAEKEFNKKIGHYIVNQFFDHYKDEDEAEKKLGEFYVQAVGIYLGLLIQKVQEDRRRNQH